MRSHVPREATVGKQKLKMEVDMISSDTLVGSGPSMFGMVGGGAIGSDRGRQARSVLSHHWKRDADFLLYAFPSAAARTADKV